MATHIAQPQVVQSSGNKPKKISEYVGRLATGTDSVSIAQMKNPGGYVGPGQTAQFEEHILVIHGMLRVDTKDASFDVHAGQAFTVKPGEWVQFRSPARDGAEYISVCVPAFSPNTVNRDPK